MHGYNPKLNNTMFSDLEMWALSTLQPDKMPSRFRYLKPRIYNKMFGNNGAINVLLNFSFSVKYEDVDAAYLEELRCQIKKLLVQLTQ